MNIDFKCNCDALMYLQSISFQFVPARTFLIFRQKAYITSFSFLGTTHFQKALHLTDPNSQGKQHPLCSSRVYWNKQSKAQARCTHMWNDLNCLSRSEQLDIQQGDNNWLGDLSDGPGVQWLRGGPVSQSRMALLWMGSSGAQYQECISWIHLQPGTNRIEESFCKMCTKVIKLLWCTTKMFQKCI